MSAHAGKSNMHDFSSPPTQYFLFLKSGGVQWSYLSIFLFVTDGPYQISDQEYCETIKAKKRIRID